jgi:aspirochlorine biosynthesis cytochrome P450 monooxygenase
MFFHTDKNQFFVTSFFQIVYNAYFHPLRKFPGPWLAGASKSYMAYYTVRGKKHYRIEEIHEKYGDVVRIAPDHLSFITESAWKDIYSFRSKVSHVFPL